MDTQKLVKLLNLSDSSNDGEALNSIRFANSLLKKDKLTWSQLIQSVKPQSEPFKQHKQNTYSQSVDEIEDMLNVCLENVTSESGLEFIESLAEHYHKRGRLSEKQINALKKWYMNVK